MESEVVTLMAKQIAMAGITIATVATPEVEIPEYVAFGGMIEMLCNSAISIMGVFAAFIFVKTMVVNLKDKEFNLSKKKNEDSLKGHVKDAVQEVINAMDKK